MTKSPSGSKAVLVVEDNADDVALLEIAARKASGGVLFHFARDGAEALAYLRGEGGFADREQFPIPELVLLDLRLPEIDGFAVLKWIRNHPKLKHLKVFVWSGVEPVEQREQAKQAGADMFIPKPLHLDGLIELVGGIARTLMETS
jgi:CheY-like chemotaxis protein